MKGFLMVLLILANITCFGQRIGYDWVKTVSNSINVVSIIDQENKLIVVTQGKIIKYDLGGNVIWNVSDTLLNTTGITVDSENNFYLTGVNRDVNSEVSYPPHPETSTSYIYVAKYDNDGDKIWVSTTGAPSANLTWANSTSIVCDMQNAIYITGKYSKSVSFNSIELNDNNGSAIFVAKFDTAGNPIWAKRMYGINSNDGLTYGVGNDIVVDQNKNIYVTGSFRGTFNFGGNLFVSHQIGDIFLTKLDSNGTFLNTKTIGGNEHDEGVRLIIEENNNLIMLAKFGDEITINDNQFQAIDNYNNAIVIKLNNDSIVMATHIGYSNGGDIISDICLDQNQNILYVGSIGNWPTLYPKIYRINTSGQIDWSYMVAESTARNFGYNQSINSDANGGIYLAGMVRTTAYFGKEELGDNLNPYQIFIGKVDTSRQYSIRDDLEGEATLFIYPNPTFGSLNIASYKENLENSDLYLINAAGQTVKHFKLTANETKIYFYELSAGLYIGRIIGDGFIKEFKIINR